MVTPRPNDLEEKFQKLLAQIELERSLKSDHEMQHELDLLVALRLVGALFSMVFCFGLQEEIGVD